MHVRKVLVCFAPLFLAGCTFHSSQLETVRAILSPPEALPEHFWIMQLQGEKLPLVAVVETPPVTSFVNAAGVSINHDGKDITFVGGWPDSRGEIRISRTGDQLIHRLADGSTIEVLCSDWALVTPQEWQMDCQATSDLEWRYQNKVNIDENGRITSLYYALWPGLPAVDLTWYPVSGEDPSILSLE